MKIAVFSGGYDPLHVGHLRGFHEAAGWTDRIIVGLNSDEWLKKKKGYVFMPWEERDYILNFIGISQLEVWGFDDKDGTAMELLKKVDTVHRGEEIYFCNGGDRESCPEEDLWEDWWTQARFCTDIVFLYGVGGGKVQSSSELVKNAMHQKEVYEKEKWNQQFLGGIHRDIIGGYFS